ncbi:vacuolar protein sorting protein 16 [Trypanosoma theileri]|uniref:Vacuolar protein sorting protein 16 n=1 Tax=Trypanosoma theileri TaxID=67003 RepID=A0A1X0P477_9TRYP|nr:vacuolar protein sorting protein 16 [Trypanosoma theileri]ORC91737.1 vacuolar protein sorting protein 16 [Trypanosoma theileri]
MVERQGEWFPFTSELYCRKLTLYDHMYWNEVGSSHMSESSSFSLAACAFVCMAPFGGSVAIIFTDALEQQTEVIDVRVYSSAGEFQTSVSIPSDVGRPINMGWTKEEGLVILTDQNISIFFESSYTTDFSTNQRNTACSLYPYSLSLSRTIRLKDNELSISKSLYSKRIIILSCMTTEGIFSLDSEGWICGLLYEERRGPKVLDPVRLTLTGIPTIMDFIPPEWNDDGDIVLYIITTSSFNDKIQSTLHVFTSGINFNEKVQKHIPGSTVLSMKVNHTGSKVALFTDKAVLYILSSNLNSIDFSFQMGQYARKPEKLEWCGNSFIMIHFNVSDFHKELFFHNETSMFTLLIPIIPNTSIQCERLDWEKSGTSGRIATVSEIDGVRLISEKACYFLEEVPQSLVSLSRIKPLSPSAELLAAYYSDTSNRLLKVRELLSKWGNTVFAQVLDEIIDAAAHEFSPDQQHLLLSGASFGNEVNRQYDSDTFVEVVRRLRVLHAIRSYPGGRMPLSFRQYCTLAGSDQMRALAPSEAKVLVDRLSNKGCFQLALDITNALNMKPLSLLSQWSCQKVRDVSLDDITVYTHIREAFQHHSGSSYMESALTAFRIGRDKLAIKLLNEDFRVHTKVTVFLLVGQWELALHWAALGNDADLLHLALTKIIATIEDRKKLFTVLQGYPTTVVWLLLGAHLFPKWRVLAEEMCMQIGDATLALYYARYGIICALEESAVDLKWRKLKDSLLYMERKTPNISNEKIDISEDDKTIDNRTLEPFDDTIFLPKSLSFSLDKTLTMLGKCKKMRPTPNEKFTATVSTGTNYPLCFPSFSVDTSEGEYRWLSIHCELVEIQNRLAVKYNDTRFLNSSITRTIYLCILHEDEKRAEEMRSKYHVGDKKYIYTKLLALCEVGKWTEVEKLAGVSGGRFGGKPSIGYLPFLEQFALHSQIEVALRFVSRLDETTKRVEWFVKLGQPCMAMDEAFREKDISLIQQIMKKTNDAAALEYGAQQLHQLHRI